MKTNANQFLFSLLVLILCSCLSDESLVVIPHVQTIEVSIFDEGEVTIPEAQVQIFQGEMMLAEFTSQAEVNHFSFSGDFGKQYLLKVAKAGYETHTATFSADARKENVDAVMQIRMKPVLELVVKNSAEDEFYSIDMAGSGEITIVWPNNTTQILAMPFSTDMDMGIGTGQKIMIKGDLDKVTSFRAFGYNTDITNISGLRHLRNMISFEPGSVMLSETLDLHHNKELQTVSVYRAELPIWFSLPKQHEINFFTLFMSDRLITTNEIDELINNIYKNTVREGIHGGTIRLFDSDLPSPETVHKINILQNDYGWSIDLNYPFEA